MNPHVDYLLRSKSAELALPFFLGKNASKEISESMGCLWAAKRLKNSLNNYVVVVVGDGVKPRTGVLFAMFTGAMVHSVDPLMRPVENLKVDRLQLHPRKAEEIIIGCGGKRALIVLPHSHCPMEEAVKCVKNYSGMDIINLPCCVPVPNSFLNIDNAPKVWRDNNIISEKRMVYLWEDYL